MIHFKLDTDISFAQLTDGRLDRYGIATVIGAKDIWGRLTATISFDGSKILVRSDSQNNVTANSYRRQSGNRLHSECHFCRIRCDIRRRS
jgi:hypothetical protein